jgi:Protein of unknown function (DUF3644)
MSRGLPRKVAELLSKARHSALLAVETYNRPSAPFRTFGYIVLMQIAWTSLLHAIFERQRVKPYYRKKGSPRFVLLEGEPKRWELEECVNQYWQGKDTAVAQNLRFMIKLRNKVEHRDLPGLDIHVLGECQAMLFNFETLLDREFGSKYAINESLVIPLQLSKLRTQQGGDALRQLIRPLPEDLRSWVQAFRSSLTQDEIDSHEFSFRVLLIPELKNNPSRDALPVQFVPYEPGREPEMDKAIALIKRSQVPIVNQGFIKPGEVVRQVRLRLPPGTPFSMQSHIQCWHYFKVRPGSNDPDPEICKTNYCIYDSTHEDYVYTPAWVEFLVSEFAKPGRLEEVMNFGRPGPAVAHPAASPAVPPAAPPR